MSGGAREYTMGVMEDSLGSNVPSSGYSSSSNSGFKGKNLYDSSNTTGPDFPEAKYYDIYGYGTAYSDYARGKVGDATKETNGWYNSGTNFFLDTTYPWFVRGGALRLTTRGIFSFDHHHGDGYTNVGSRIVHK